MNMHVKKYAEAQVEQTPWGSLTWYVSGRLGNSQTLTVGRCIIKPGCANPVHIHPNCDEVLHVLHGTISHSLEDGGSVELHVGDTIAIPATLPHNATNIGEEDAVLLVTFSSGDRQTLHE